MEKNNRHKKYLFLCLAVIISVHILLPKPVYSEVNRINIAYINSESLENYDSYIDRADNSLDVVSPNYFNIDEDGKLRVSPIDKSYIKAIHKKGIKVIPYLSNHWDRELGRLALKNSKSVIKDLVVTIEKYNLDCINIDIENLT